MRQLAKIVVDDNKTCSLMVEHGMRLSGLTPEQAVAAKDIVYIVYSQGWEGGAGAAALAINKVKLENDADE